MNLQGRTLHNKCIAFFIAISLLVTSLFVVDMGVFAADETTAVVTANGLNVRAGIGTSYDKVAYLQKGDVVKVLDIGYNTDGTVWYQIETSSGVQGWVSGAYVELTIGTEDFDLYLKLSGFPESYHESLKALHDKYPNWIFQAQQTKINWEDMIAAQTKLGMSLTHKGNPTSWKSVQTGAYDWTTSSWIELDSGGWVAASEELVRYYVDVRNFLNEGNLFQFLKQSYDASSLSEEEIAAVKTNLTTMVAGTFLAGECVETDETYGSYTTYIDIIMEAGKRAGVSPYVIASMIIQEQGVNGTGGCISGTEAGYEGYYNFLNINAYKTSTLSAVQKGLEYAKSKGWNTKTKSIIECAVYYGSSYVAEGQDTMYLKKFDLVGTPYTHQYMTNIQGAVSEGKHLAEAYQNESGSYSESAIQTDLVFKIPVYSNMPESVSTLPANNGNVSPNYMLKDLTVSGQSLTPTFSMYDTEYSLIVGNEIESVTIAAAAYHSGAKITGAGTVNLTVGTNVFPVVVTAESGAVRTYTISIIREEGTGQPDTPTVAADPVLSTTVYKLADSLITGITTFPVTVEDFKSNLTVTDGTIKVLAADGSEKTGNVGTGTVVKLYNTEGTEKASYTVVIYGDANGDSVVNAKDLLTIQKNNIQVKALSGAYLTAADVTRDGKVNAKDLLLVQKNNIKVSTIEQ